MNEWVSHCFRGSWETQLFTLPLFVITFLLGPVYAAPPAAHPSTRLVKIQEVQEGNNDYWLAERGGMVLWTRAAKPGARWYDAATGIAVLEGIGQIFVVDRRGRIKRDIKVVSVFDPRTLLLSDSCLIYDDGYFPIYAATWDEVKSAPKTGSVRLARYLHDARRVHIFSLRSFRELWSASESDIGLPVSTRGSLLQTLRIVNLRRCLENPATRPVITALEVNIKTARRSRPRILKITRDHAEDILSRFE